MADDVDGLLAEADAWLSENQGWGTGYPEPPSSDVIRRLAAALRATREGWEMYQRMYYDANERAERERDEARTAAAGKGAVSMGDYKAAMGAYESWRDNAWRAEAERDAARAALRRIVESPFVNKGLDVIEQGRRALGEEPS